MSSVSAAQLRSGRAMLDWSRVDLAKAARVSVATVLSAEGRAPERVSEGTTDALRVALETAGIRFMEDDGDGAGVRLCLR